MAITKLADLGYIIDKLQHIEAERTLLQPTAKDIDSYMFMYNTVVDLVNVIDKINEIIDQIHEG